MGSNSMSAFYTEFLRSTVYSLFSHDDDDDDDEYIRGSAIKQCAV